MFKILKNCHTCNAARCQMQFTLEQGEMHNFMITSMRGSRGGGRGGPDPSWKMKIY